ncbi:MAG: tetratricopeptide repeat protein [Planctomycetota bacterium]
MATAVRERVLKEALERGTVTAADVTAAEARRETYRRFGVDAPLLELLGAAGKLPQDVVEEAARGEEIPSRIAGLEVVRPAGGTPERPVFLGRRPIDGETFLVQACMRTRGDAPTEVDEFVRAMEDGRRLTGPGWIPVVEATGADGAYAAVYPVPEGLRLDEHLATKGSLTPTQAVAYLRRIGEALWQMEALGRAATFPDPSLVLVDRQGRATLVAIEVLLAGRGGAFDPREFARSAANFLARVVGPEQVTDPAVRGLLADLSSGRFEALRPASSPTASSPFERPVAFDGAGGTATPIGIETPVGPRAPAFPGPARPAPAPAPAAPAVPSWVVAAGALLVIGGGLWAVLRPSPADDPAPPTVSGARTGPDPTPGRTDPVARPGPDVATVRDEGLVALDEALAFLRESRESAPQAVIDRFRAVEARYGGSEAGNRAAAERERFQREVEEDAERRVSAIAADVDRLLAGDEIGAAHAAIARFPRALAFTRAVVRLDTLRTAVKSRAETIYATLRPTLDAASDPARKDAALAALERVKALGDPELTARATQRLADASARAAGLSARRKELAPELDRVVADALVVAGTGEVERARRPLDAAGRGVLGDVYPDRMAAAREALDRIVRVFEAAATEWRSRAGKAVTILLREHGAKPFTVAPTDVTGDRFGYTRGGAPGSVRLSALDPETIGSLAAASGRETDATLALGVATLLGATGRLAEAEAAATRASGLGATSPTLAAELAAVRVQLEAAANREVAAADATLARNREGARAGYGRAAVVAPFLALPHRRLAVWWTEERKPDEALAAWRRAKALGDASPDVLHGLARSAAAANRPDDEVLEAWRAFLAAAPAGDPRRADADADVERLATKVVRGTTLERVKAAKALLDAGKVAEAVAALEEAVAADPTSLEARRALARAAEKAEDPLRAFLAWREAHGLAKTTRDATDAKEQADRLLRAYGERPAEQTVRRGAEASAERGEYAAAVEGFKRALTMAPLDAEARLGLGGAILGVALRTGNKALFEEAVAAYDAAVRIAPDDPRAWAGRGELKRWRGDYDGAVADATAAIQRRKDYYPAYNTRGLALYSSLKFEAALADVDVVCTLAPAMATPRITRAGILVAMGRFDDAETDLAAALERNPTEAERAMVTGMRNQLAARRKATQPPK